MELLTWDQLVAMNIHYRFYSIDDFFESLQRNHLKNAEIWTNSSHFYLSDNNYQNAKKFRQKAENYNVKIVCITPEQNNPKTYNIASKSSFLKKITLNYFKNAIDVANEWECEKVLITSGWAYYSEPLEEAWKRSLEMIYQLTLQAEKRGVTLVIEALQSRESLLGNNIKSIKKILKEIHSDNLKVTLDLGAMVKAEESIEDYFNVFGEKIVHSHFIDGAPTGHLAWGDGDRNIYNDLKAFYNNGYNNHFSFEITDQRYYKDPEKAIKKTISQILPYVK